MPSVTILLLSATLTLCLALPSSELGLRGDGRPYRFNELEQRHHSRRENRETHLKKSSEFQTVSSFKSVQKRLKTSPSSRNVISPSPQSIVTSGFIVVSEFASFTECAGTPTRTFWSVGTCIDEYHASGPMSLFINYVDTENNVASFALYGGYGCGSGSLTESYMVDLAGADGCSPSVSYDPASVTKDTNPNSIRVEYVDSLSAYWTPSIDGVWYSNYTTMEMCGLQSSDVVSAKWYPANTCLWGVFRDLYLGYVVAAYSIISCSSWISFVDYFHDFTCTTPSSRHSWSSWRWTDNCENVTSNRLFTESHCTTHDGSSFDYGFPENYPTAAPTTLTVDTSGPGGYIVRSYYDLFSDCYQGTPNIEVLRLNACVSDPNYNGVLYSNYEAYSDGTFAFLYTGYESTSCIGEPSHKEYRHYRPGVCAYRVVTEFSAEIPSFGRGILSLTYTDHDSCVTRSEENLVKAYYDPSINSGGFCNGGVTSCNAEEGYFRETFFAAVTTDSCGGDTYSRTHDLEMCWNSSSSFITCSPGSFDETPPNDVFPEPTALPHGVWPGWKAVGIVDSKNSPTMSYDYSPRTVSCKESCAMTFGGDSSDFVCSTEYGNMNGQANAAMSDFNVYTSMVVPDDFKFCEYFDREGCISAYVDTYDMDRIINYCYAREEFEPAYPVNSPTLSPHTEVRSQDCSYSASNTGYATKNVAICRIEACVGDIVLASGCVEGSSCVGVQYLRLLSPGGDFALESNDHYCGDCSQLSYVVKAGDIVGDCGFLQLAEGCWSSLSCSGDILVTVTGASAEVATPPPSQLENPGMPTKPEKPVKRPGKPDKPGKPGHPGKPDKPGKPEHPGKPDKPGKPEHPGKPNKPGKPGHPEKPEKPDSDKPNRPGKLNGLISSIDRLINRWRLNNN